MTRWKAASIHIGISATVALIACLLLLFVWYPPPYFKAAGAERLLLLIVGVDVTLGPLLTLIVFKSGKPGLKFDLTCIGVVQAIALVYGFHIMLASRPVFLVAAVDRFTLVAANDLEAKDLAEAPKPAWRHKSWTGPVLVAALTPSDPKLQQALLWSGLAGKDIEKFPRYYADYAKAAPGLLQHAKPLAALTAMHPQHKAEITAWLRKHQRQADTVVWLPIVARDSDLSMLMDKTSGQPLGALALDPWPSDAPGYVPPKPAAEAMPAQPASAARAPNHSAAPAAATSR